MDIRQLEYLVTLAREKHFTRAAAACNVTQPTLSGGIRHLERLLGVAIVERGQRYHGLTPEGEVVLKWATRILEDQGNLHDDLARLTGSGGGRLTLGVIPSALPAVPALTAPMRGGGRDVRFTVLSRSSEEIRRGLEDFSLDAGVTYLGNEPVGPTVSQPLYTERYRLFVAADHALAGRDRVSWAEAADHPLCALTPDMQNRRIVDAAFQSAGARPVPDVESNSVVNLCAYVRHAGLACILPEAFTGLIGGSGDLRLIPVVEPVAEYTVGLVAYQRDPLPRLVEDLFRGAKGFSLPNRT